MRYIYDQFESYFGKMAPFYQRVAACFVRPFLQSWDQISNCQVNEFVANSYFVAKRVKDYYGLEADVIHPFVDISDFIGKETSKEDFYLMVSAFAPNKRVDLAISAFNKLGKTLKIIGSGQQENELKKMSESNIEFLGNLNREEVVDHLLRAKGFIFPGVEDFGITPLEALAAKTPVIAYKKAGVLETLNDNVAQFFLEPTTSCLIEAVNFFEEKKFEEKALFQRALDFSKESFKKKIQKKIESMI